MNTCSLDACAHLINYTEIPRGPQSGRVGTSPMFSEPFGQLSSKPHLLFAIFSGFV